MRMVVSESAEGVIYFRAAQGAATFLSPTQSQSAKRQIEFARTGVWRFAQACAEGFNRVLHRSLDRLLVSDVAVDVAGLTAGRGDGLDHLIAIGHVGNDHLGSFGGKALRSNAAQT